MQGFRETCGIQINLYARDETYKILAKWTSMGRASEQRQPSATFERSLLVILAVVMPFFFLLIHGTTTPKRATLPWLYGIVVGFKDCQ